MYFDHRFLGPRNTAVLNGLVVSATVTIAAALAAPAAHAGTNLEGSRQLGKIMIIDNERRALKQAGEDTSTDRGIIPPGQDEAPASVGGKTDTALLPQLGYDPESGFILGVKYSVVGFGASKWNLDVGATQSSAGDSSIGVSLGAPRLFGNDRLMGLVQLGYDLTPKKPFYGLGNNGVGDHKLSTHELHDTKALFTVGYRLAPHWMAAATAGFDRITIGRGKSDNKPRTLERYPNLPEVNGGYNNPIGLSLYYNTQRDVTRPMHGWNNVVKIQHVGPELGNDVNYTRYLADFKYTHPIFSDKNILGFRLDGEYLTGSGDDLPFYEFASIGGSDNLEGFEPDRFRGQSRVFAQVGYRRSLADFNFYNIWRVRLDGALFGGVGRVFLDKSRLPNDLSSDAYPNLDNQLQYSYGTGLRIALGEALIARVDAGFSKESKGLVYLTFGNRF